METGGRRIDQYLKSNQSLDIVTSTGDAFAPNQTDEERINCLTDLRGVSVPVASAILSVFDPKSFAVIDFRTLRALAAAEPSVVDTTNYEPVAKFAWCLQNYREDPVAYELYMEIVRELAQSYKIFPRELDMALWAYDKEKFSPPS